MIKALTACLVLLVISMHFSTVVSTGGATTKEKNIPAAPAGVPLAATTEASTSAATSEASTSAATTEASTSTAPADAVIYPPMVEKSGGQVVSSTLSVVLAAGLLVCVIQHLSG